MIIIESYNDPRITIKTDAQTREVFAQRMYGGGVGSIIVDQIKNLMRPGKTHVMFSGGWNYDFDAVYFEQSQYKILNKNFVGPFAFVDQQLSDTTQTILKNNLCNNLLFLNSTMLRYLSIEELNDRLSSYKQYITKDGIIIAVIPLSLIKFNRLNITKELLLTALNCTVSGDYLLVCR